MRKHLSLWIAAIAAGSAILGSAVGGVSTYAATVASKRYEERQQIRQLAFQAAIEAYKLNHALVPGFVERGVDVTIPPLDDYIINWVKMARLLSDDMSNDELDRAYRVLKARGSTHRSPTVKSGDSGLTDSVASKRMSGK